MLDLGSDLSSLIKESSGDRSGWYSCRFSDQSDTFLRTGQDFAQIKGGRCCRFLSRQCSKSRCISPMRIFDGSAHVNPSGVHCGAIHSDGVAQTCTHEIVALLFPETYPNIHEGQIYMHNQSKHTNMIG